MEKKTIHMAPREVLLSIDFIYALADALRALDLSRRRTVDWLAEVIFGWIEAGNVILDWDGNELEVHDEIIDDAHGDDPAFTWISDQMRRDIPRRRPRQSMLLRLGLYSVAFQIVGTPINPQSAD